MSEFKVGDKVVGFIDGWGLRRGEVVSIDPDAPWPYVVRDDESGLFGVFCEDELSVWDGSVEP